MIFYTVCFHTLPRIAFVCSLSDTLTERSRNIIDHRANMIELSFWNGCERILETEDTQHLLPDNMLAAFFPDARYLLYPKLDKATDCATVWSQSVAVVAEDMVYARHEMENPAEIDMFLHSLPQDTFVLPFLYDPGEVAIERLHRQYHALCVSYMENTAAGKLRCVSSFLEFCAFLDASFRKSMHTAVAAPAYTSKSAYYYVYKIKKRILTDLAAPVSLSGIAAELGRSADYIGKIFKSECGVSVHEYVNRQRIMRLQDMICFDRSRPLSAACTDVGLTDLRYAQRLFKKYTGVTMQQCRQLSGGLTLYHPNPWRETNLDHDIYPVEENSVVP